MDDSVATAANIVLTFAVPVDPERSHVEVSGAFGGVPVGVLRQGPRIEDPIVPLTEGLPSGTYSVNYKATAIDGSKMFGSTSITVPPSPAAPTGADLMGAK
ncbi:copper resistance protein CopC [Rhizobium sp. CFBP 13726]|uniref:copper resistance protein CopC n=1 Tax=Rhizobium sp. CFBP 13726 TaxID=2775296 RepID=UPI00406CDF14